MNAPLNQATADATVFKRGTGQWSGVVMIERPRNASRETLCRVTSARTMAFDAKRAIGEMLPYSLFRHYFVGVNSDHLCVYAEFNNGHLEFYERASKREYFLNATNPLPLAVH